MIIAELNGKIPSKLEDKEDILTSNIFSFLKYSSRRLLMDYLSLLGIDVTLNDSKNAEFIFWPKYDDRTEPDLVIVCGDNYILFEAKLYSDFSPETTAISSQITREIKMGKVEAENQNKDFIYVAITAEYYKSKTKYISYESQEYKFIWTNWQMFTNFLEVNLTNNNLLKNREFAIDLYSLLVKKRLRSYSGIISINLILHLNSSKSVFYNVKSSRFKGEFSGYTKILLNLPKIGQYNKIFKKTFFQKMKSININQFENIFFNGNYTK
jgi:hypothetical protein